MPPKKATSESRLLKGLGPRTAVVGRPTKYQEITITQITQLKPQDIKFETISDREFAQKESAKIRYFDDVTESSVLCQAGVAHQRAFNLAPVFLVAGVFPLRPIWRILRDDRRVLCLNSGEEIWMFQVLD